MPQFLFNEHRDVSLGFAEPWRTEIWEFHRRLPLYAPTPLATAPAIAASLDVAEVLVKDESSRLGLPSFKILGASWAVYQLLQRRLNGGCCEWERIEDLAARAQELGPIRLVAATDGNHGRAVARMAKLFGWSCLIFVPAGTVTPRILSIEEEGAEVSVVDGSYDDAVRRAATEGSERSWVVSDTSWPGYHEVPKWVVEGYSTIFREIDEALAAHRAGFDLILVQMGVGGLASAAVRHYRSRNGPEGKAPRIVGVEPEQAACVYRALSAGEIVTVPPPHRSIMAGLCCGRMSEQAFPVVAAGVDVVVLIDDDAARRAMRELAQAGIVAGESGAAGLAGLRELLTGPGGEQRRRLLGLNSSTRVLLLSTEGATDPDGYGEIVPHPSTGASVTITGGAEGAG
jgi:diaminopropionate ammonia-lyase